MSFRHTLIRSSKTSRSLYTSPRRSIVRSGELTFRSFGEGLSVHPPTNFFVPRPRPSCLTFAQDIRIIDIKRAPKSFDSRTRCSGRRYEYLMPTFVLAPREYVATLFQQVCERLFLTFLLLGCFFLSFIRLDHIYMYR